MINRENKTTGPSIVAVIVVVLAPLVVYVAGYFLFTGFQGEMRVYEHGWQARIYTAVTGIEAAITGDQRIIVAKDTSEEFLISAHE